MILSNTKRREIRVNDEPHRVAWREFLETFEDVRGLYRIVHYILYCVLDNDILVVSFLCLSVPCIVVRMTGRRRCWRRKTNDPPPVSSSSSSPSPHVPSLIDFFMTRLGPFHQDHHRRSQAEPSPALPSYEMGRESPQFPIHFVSRLLFPAPEKASFWPTTDFRTVSVGMPATAPVPPCMMLA